MLPRRRFLHLASGALASAWPTLAAAAYSKVIVVYLHHAGLDEILEYRSILAELLSPHSVDKLIVVRAPDGTFGLVRVFDGDQSKSEAQKVAKEHEEILCAAFGDEDVLTPKVVEAANFVPTFHLLLGVYSKEREARRALSRALAVFGSEAKIVVERTETEELQLIAKLYVSRSEANAETKKRARKWGSETLDVIQDCVQPVEMSANTLVVEDTIGVRQKQKAPLPRGPRGSSRRTEEGSSVVEVRTRRSFVSQHPDLVASMSSPLRHRFNRHVQELRSRDEIEANEETSWYVYTLHDNRTWLSINGDHSRQTASMVKPFIALAYFHRMRRRRAQLSQKVDRLMRRMIADSSNGATNWFIDELGGPREVQRILSRNYAQIFKETTIIEKIPWNGRTYRNRASAMDYVRFCRALWHAEVPGAIEILRAMGLSKRDRLVIPAKSIPRSTYVMNKTGSTARLIGDFGIVMARTRDGQRVPYVMVAIVEKQERVEGMRAYRAWKSAREVAIGKASSFVYDHLQDHYRLA